MLDGIKRMIKSDISLFIFILTSTVLVGVARYINSQYIGDVLINLLSNICAGVIAAGLCYGRKSIFDNDASKSDSYQDPSNEDKKWV